MSGAIKANGEIDWDCPCLKGMAYGMARSSDESEKCERANAPGSIS
jgi:hypothetical protein